MVQLQLRDHFIQQHNEKSNPSIHILHSGQETTFQQDAVFYTLIFTEDGRQKILNGIAASTLIM
jgi:hypothetical protein